MEGNFNENQKLFYRTFKNCRKENETTLNQLKDKRRRLIKEDSAIMERWKKHIYELLEGNRNRKEDEEIRNVDFASTTNIEGENISRKEIQSVLIKQRREGEEILLKMLNIVWEQGHIPEEEEKSSDIPHT
ncbi:hypothetical protein CBL_10002 [Carabus blaptoides fortunei]